MFFSNVYATDETFDIWLKSFKKLAILLDIGNTKAHGFFVEDYVKLFPGKIFAFKETNIIDRAPSPNP